MHILSTLHCTSKLCVYNVRDITEPSAVEICSVVVGEGLSDISVNPLNWKQMLLLGPTKLTLWTLEHCGKEDLLTPV